jgi:Xaa-Pro aminopeptidase
MTRPSAQPAEEGLLIAAMPVPPAPDLTRMRADRHAKLQEQMTGAGLDGLVLMGTNAVAYATGALTPGVDSSHGLWARPVALIATGQPAPHLYTPYPEGAPPELPAGFLHPPLYPELDDGVAGLVAALAEVFGPDARLGSDEVTHAMRRGLAGRLFAGTSTVLAAAKLCKTPDELACIRTAQHLNEVAMWDVRKLLRPGVRQTDLSARFLQRVFELGATTNAIDPIWQVMPAARGDGPWTTHGGLAFPTPTGDRIFEAGDVIWVDSGITYEGYASDFGRTWIVGTEPSPSARQQSQFDRWAAVVAAVLECCRPGATALELGRAATAANGGERPWIEHFYLAHGVGTDSAEMPLIGTDLGEAFDERLVLQPGMVLVLEPVIWDDGAAGYRSEEVIAITEDGWVQLSSHPYDPFEGPW